jgi:hypothetical protein
MKKERGEWRKLIEEVTRHPGMYQQWEEEEEEEEEEVKEEEKKKKICIHAQ